MKSTIATEHLVKIYSKRRVVDDVSIKMKQGEIVGLLGPNGAGKTTTFYMVVGIIKPDKGYISYNGENITKMPMYKRAKKGICYLPQEPSIFRKLSVRDNIAAILEHQDYSKKERKDRLYRIMQDLNIDHLEKQMAYTLSGGERRRVEIARALAVSPNFLLLDEPFAGVDPIAVFDIQTIISDLRKQGLGILITDHNVRETLEITDRAYIMNEGKILVQGPADVLVNDPIARKIYLGEKFIL